MAVAVLRDKIKYVALQLILHIAQGRWEVTYDAVYYWAVRHYVIVFCDI
jgi:hypothetical protein